MNNNKYGKGCSTIPENLINYSPQYDRETIKNERGKKLVYHKFEKGYSIFSDDPSSFLTEDDLNSNWESFNWFDDFVKEFNINVL